MSLFEEKKYLLNILAKQDYSRKQLSNKLHNRNNISSDEIEFLLDEFEKSKWLSDQRFVETFVIGELAKLRGRTRIINTAIYQKGLSRELIEQYFNMLDIDWFDLCKQCLIKKYKDISKLKSDYKLKQKAVNYLVYNGFSSEEIEFVVNDKI